jgi:quinol monooxygenase YgiN
MQIRRRELAGSALALAVVGAPQARAAQGDRKMYGLMGRMLAQPGKRDELLAIMLGELAEMPGCLSYVVASDPAHADGIWITEVWESQAQHQGSLKLASVQATIAKARPLIAGFDNRTETTPLGGLGLSGTIAPR